MVYNYTLQAFLMETLIVCVFHCLLSIFYYFTWCPLAGCDKATYFCFLCQWCKTFYWDLPTLHGEATPIRCRVFWYTHSASVAQQKENGESWRSVFVWCVLYFSIIKRHSILLLSFSYSKRRDIHKHEKTPRGEVYARAWGSSTIVEPTCPLSINLVSISHSGVKE